MNSGFALQVPVGTNSAHMRLLGRTRTKATTTRLPFRRTSRCRRIEINVRLERKYLRCGTLEHGTYQRGFAQRCQATAMHVLPTHLCGFVGCRLVPARPSLFGATTYVRVRTRRQILSRYILYIFEYMILRYIHTQAESSVYVLYIREAQGSPTITTTLMAEMRL